MLYYIEVKGKKEKVKLGSGKEKQKRGVKIMRHILPQGFLGWFLPGLMYGLGSIYRTKTTKAFAHTYSVSIIWLSIKR